MIFLLYCLLAIFFTYPLIFHLFTHMQGAGDGFYFMWTLWWFPYSIMTGQNPLINNTIFHPAPEVRLIWGTAVNEIPAMVMEPLLGPVATYNLLILFSISFAGYTAFLLVRSLTGNTKAAFVSGFIYGFSPFHFVNAFKGLLNITAWQYMPLCALAGLRLVKSPNLRNSLFFGLTLSLVAQSDGYIFCNFFALFIPVLIVHALLKKGRGLVPWLMASFAVFIPLSLPFLLSYVTMARISSHAVMASYDMGIYSQHLLRYFIPYKFHPIWGRFFSWFYPDPFFEASCFTGYLPFILAGAALFMKNRETRVFWGVIGISALILSLGPYLHVWNLVTIMGYPVPLPYLIFSHIPFFSLLRLPVRFSILLILSLSALSGIALKNVRNSFIFIALFLVIAMEYVLLFPYPLTDAKIPRFYSKLKEDSSVRAILELPCGQDDPDYILNTNKYMYYQTFHHKPIVSGHTPRVPDGLEDFTRSFPLINALTHPKTLIKGDIIPLNIDRMIKDGLENLSRHSIDLVLLHKDAMDALSKHELKAISKLLIKALGKPFHEDEDLQAFRVRSYTPRRLDSSPFYALGKGWYDPHFKGSKPHRHAVERAELLVTAAPGSYRLKFGFIRPHIYTKTLELYSGERLIEEIDVSSLSIGKEYDFMTKPFNIERRTMILFKVKEGAVRPVDIVSPIEAIEKPFGRPIAMDVLGIELVPQ